MKGVAMVNLDIIQGIVLDILKSDSFSLKLEHAADNNIHTYQPIEKIRIKGHAAPNLNSYEGMMAYNRLNTRVGNKRVQCAIYSREEDNFLLCDVRVLLPVKNLSDFSQMNQNKA
jgi:hypothetical protein